MAAIQDADCTDYVDLRGFFRVWDCEGGWKDVNELIDCWRATNK